jgi:hypothetical protein
MSRAMIFPTGVGQLSEKLFLHLAGICSNPYEKVTWSPDETTCPQEVDQVIF